MAFFPSFFRMNEGTFALQRKATFVLVKSTSTMKCVRCGFPYSLVVFFPFSLIKKQKGKRPKFHLLEVTSGEKTIFHIKTNFIPSQCENPSINQSLLSVGFSLQKKEKKLKSLKKENLRFGCCVCSCYYFVIFQK